MKIVKLTVLAFIISSFGVLSSSIALSVTGDCLSPHRGEQLGWITTEAADRAMSDVQIRKLKSLLLSQEGGLIGEGTDSNFERLKLLQKKAEKGS
jgi:hypothetical protein